MDDPEVRELRGHRAELFEGDRSLTVRMLRFAHVCWSAPLVGLWDEIERRMRTFLLTRTTDEE